MVGFVSYRKLVSPLCRWQHPPSTERECLLTCAQHSRSLWLSPRFSYLDLTTPRHPRWEVVE